MPSPPESPWSWQRVRASLLFLLTKRPGATTLDVLRDHRLIVADRHVRLFVDRLNECLAYAERDDAWGARVSAQSAVVAWFGHVRLFGAAPPNGIVFLAQTVVAEYLRDRPTERTRS